MTRSSQSTRTRTSHIYSKSAVTVDDLGILSENPTDHTLEYDLRQQIYEKERDNDRVCDLYSS